MSKIEGEDYTFQDGLYYFATGGAGCTAAVVATSTLKGALIGGAIGTVAGGTGNVIVNRVKTGSWKNSGKKFLEDFSYGFTAGAITGAVVGGGKGVHNVVKATKIGLQVVEENQH